MINGIRAMFPFEAMLIQQKQQSWPRQQKNKNSLGEISQRYVENGAKGKHYIAKHSFEYVGTKSINIQSIYVIFLYTKEIIDINILIPEKLQVEKCLGREEGQMKVPNLDVRVKAV